MNRRSDVAAAALSYEREKEIVNNLIRRNLAKFCEHFEDESVRSILNEGFCRKVVGYDWKAELERSTDDRSLAFLICAYYGLIECSISSPRAGNSPEPVAFSAARNHALEYLDHLAWSVRSSIDSSKSLSDPSLTDEQLRWLALLDSDLQGEAIIASMAKSEHISAADSSPETPQG